MIENTEKNTRETQAPHRRKAFSRIRARPYSDEDALSVPSRYENRRKIRYEICPVFSDQRDVYQDVPGEQCIFISNEINTVYIRAFAEIGAPGLRGWSLVTDYFLLIATIRSCMRSRTIVGTRIVDAGWMKVHFIVSQKLVSMVAASPPMDPSLGVSPENLMKNVIPNLTLNVEELLAQKWKRGFFLQIRIDVPEHRSRI